MNLAESWRVLSECIVPQSAATAWAHATPHSADVTATRTWQALFSDQPRPLLLPANHRRARQNGLRLFLPQLWRKSYARARLQAHDLLGTLAQLPLLTLPSVSGPLLPDHIASTEAQQLAFLIGTPGPYQKAAMLVMSPQGEPLSLVKIALGKQANEMVRNEAAWLSTLNTCAALARAVPQLQRQGTADNGYRYFAQSIVPGRACAGTFTPAHADFLRRLGSMDWRIGPFSSSSSCQSLHDNFSQLAPRLTADRYQLLDAALKDCLQRLHNWHGPFVTSHGDFAFWNIRTNSRTNIRRSNGSDARDRYGEICVFDWEYATPNTSPLFDLFHFHLIAPAAAKRRLGVRDMKHALQAARAFALLTYPEFDWSPPIVAAHGLAYLLHTVFFYGVSRGELVESHPVIRLYCRLIQDRARWLP